ncbi:MAG: PH domain-containing protein [Chitinophagaceae bacterium]|nr:MAG: PH domain-containing protein [Chitinophagaceae bacterium]
MGFFSSLMGNAGVAKPEELQQEYGNLLAEGEGIEIGFKLLRDVFIFTNKRLILVDKQGITGKKVTYFSVVYKSITRFSIETAGHFDLDAELKIWISSEVNPSVSRKFNKQVNIYDLQKVLANHVLG